MLVTGPTICDSRDGSCPHGCNTETGCRGLVVRERQERGEFVPVPTTESEAVGMLLVAHAWLKANAPHRLKGAQ